MLTFAIRSVSPTLAASIDEAARAQGQSREEFLRRHLAQHFGEPSAVLAWFHADRPGELTPGPSDSPLVCISCGQDAEFWFAISDKLTLSGPFCAGCAGQD